MRHYFERIFTFFFGALREDLAAHSTSKQVWWFGALLLYASFLVVLGSIGLPFRVMVACVILSYVTLIFLCWRFAVAARTSPNSKSRTVRARRAAAVTAELEIAAGPEMAQATGKLSRLMAKVLRYRERFTIANFVRWLCKAAIGLLALVGIGYLSSALTLKQCENNAARYTANIRLEGKPFYLLLGDAPAQGIFSRNGIKYMLYTVVPVPGKHARRVIWPGGEPMPPVNAGGHIAELSYGYIAVPFLVSVNHSEVYGSLGAEGGTLQYFCCFGFPILLHDNLDWVS